jgi:hypothetical protein
MLASQATPVLANHTAQCQEWGIVNRHVGYASTSWPAHRYGVKARIGGASLGLCTQPRVGEGSSSVGWVAIEGPPYCCNIVQIGYGTCYGWINETCEKADASLQRDFYAWGRDGATPGCSGFSTLEPTGHWYSVFSADNDYSVEEDASGLFTLRSLNATTFIGTNLICWTNQYVTVSAESWDYGDAIGGTVANHLVFSLERFKTTPNEAWRVLPSLCSPGYKGPSQPPTGIFHCDVVNSNSLHMYTSR